MREAAILVAATLLPASAPLRVDWSGATPQLRLHGAEAKNGNNGKGSNGGNNGKGSNRNSGDKGNKGKNGGAHGRSAQPADAVIDKQVGVDSVGIRYRNGYREQVSKGRFIMKDAKGRTVINRRATPVDRVRLWLKQVAP
jgi:hypothetical protein